MADETMSQAETLKHLHQATRMFLHDIASTVQVLRLCGERLTADENCFAENERLRKAFSESVAKLSAEFDAFRASVKDMTPAIPP